MIDLANGSIDKLIRIQRKSLEDQGLFR